MFSVKMRRMAVARHKRAAVYPKDHRQLFLGRLGGSPHIQIQAVLAHGLGHRVKLPLIKAAGLHPQLRAAGTGAGTVPHALPVGGGHGLVPAQRPHRRRCIGNAVIGSDAGPAAGNALYAAIFYFGFTKHNANSFRFDFLVQPSGLLRPECSYIRARKKLLPGSWSLNRYDR